MVELLTYLLIPVLIALAICGMVQDVKREEKNGKHRQRIARR